MDNCINDNKNNMEQNKLNTLKIDGINDLSQKQKRKKKKKKKKKKKRSKLKTIGLLVTKVGSASW